MRQADNELTCCSVLKVHFILAFQENVPHTLSEGPVLRRKILLPNMEGYTTTEQLIEREPNNVSAIFQVSSQLLNWAQTF